LSDRLRLAGILEGQRLVSAYRAMDVFAFASQTETQGMVLTEAMAAGIPVVALDGPGVRDVMRDAENGRMLSRADTAEFAAALAWIADLGPQTRHAICRGAAETANAFSLRRCADRALAFYERLRSGTRTARPIDDSAWSASLRWIEREWKIMTHHAKAIGGALVDSATSEEPF
jgi:glycosyltransferase involved in cell wall biosynthesis